MTSSRQKKKNRIKDLPLTSRPREKLLAKGAENLSAAELIAILLGVGTKKKNAIKLAEFFLERFPLQKLSKISSSQLSNTAGIGKAKATRILAALELGHRIFSPASLTKTILHTKEDMIKEFKDIANKKQEYLVVLYLNARHELIQKEIVALGNLNAIHIEPKEIFAPAIASPCAAIIIAHNHPSGNPMPSNEDVLFTKRIQQAGEIMGIHLIDHFIICVSDYFSFRGDVKNTD